VRLRSWAMGREADNEGFDVEQSAWRRHLISWVLVPVACIALLLVLFQTIRAKPAPLKSSTTPDASYTLRGVIDTLPQATGPDKYIKIHHEELPTFKNKKGEVVGMPEMIMDFEQIAPEVRVQEFKVGDVVEFTFEVRWSPRVVTRITQMRKLDAGTNLGLKAVTEGKSRG